MIEPLLIAAPPAAQPATNYFEVIGIPLLVAVVTSLLTAYLATLRSRDERLASLRLETYRDIVVYLKRWTAGLRAAVLRDERGHDAIPAAESWEPDADRFIDQLNLLPMLTGKRAYARIESSVDDMVETTRALEKKSGSDVQMSEIKAIIEKLEALAEVLIEEGRREVRRIRA